MQNKLIVVNICEKFHNDRLRNGRSLGNGKPNNKKKKKGKKEELKSNDPYRLETRFSFYTALSNNLGHTVLPSVSSQEPNFRFPVPIKLKCFQIHGLYSLTTWPSDQGLSASWSHPITEYERRTDISTVAIPALHRLLCYRAGKKIKTTNGRSIQKYRKMIDHPFAIYTIRW